MATPANYSDNLKNDITGLILTVDQSVNKIKELAKNVDMQNAVELSKMISTTLQGKYDKISETFPSLVQAEGAKDASIIVPLKYVTSAAPALIRQRQLDSATLTIYSIKS